MGLLICYHNLSYSIFTITTLFVALLILTKTNIMSEDQMDIDTLPEVEQSEPKPKQRFEVKKWTAVAFWSWDIVVDVCAICRNHLMEPCIDCQANVQNNSDNQCVAAWGQCNHAFHMHCINRWLRTRQVCPLDSTEWVFHKFGA